MVLKTVDLETTPLTLEELLAELGNDTEILLTRGTVPVARVAPAGTMAALKEHILGLHEGEGWISDDFTDELPDALVEVLRDDWQDAEASPDEIETSFREAWHDAMTGNVLPIESLWKDIQGIITDLQNDMDE